MSLSCMLTLGCGLTGYSHPLSGAGGGREVGCFMPAVSGLSQVVSRSPRSVMILSSVGCTFVGGQEATATAATQRSAHDDDDDDVRPTC